MNKGTVTFFFLTVAIAVGATTLHAQQAAALDPTTTIAVSCRPLRLLLEGIAYNEFNFKEVIPEGVDPHLYEITPRTRVMVEQASALVLNGGGLEDHWLPQDIQKPQFILDQSKEHSEHHAWLDPHLILTRIPALTSFLCSLHSARCDQFQTNSKRLNETLSKFLTTSKKNSSTLSNTKFISMHPAWDTFAISTGLTPDGFVKDTEVRFLTPQDLVEIAVRVAADKVSVLVVDPYTEASVIDTVSKDLKTQPVVLDEMARHANSLIVFYEQSYSLLFNALKNSIPHT